MKVGLGQKDVELLRKLLYVGGILGELGLGVDQRRSKVVEEPFFPSVPAFLGNKARKFVRRLKLVEDGGAFIVIGFLELEEQ